MEKSKVIEALTGDLQEELIDAGEIKPDIIRIYLGHVWEAAMKEYERMIEKGEIKPQ